MYVIKSFSVKVALCVRPPPSHSCMFDVKDAPGSRNACSFGDTYCTLLERCGRQNIKSVLDLDRRACLDCTTRAEIELKSAYSVCLSFSLLALMPFLNNFHFEPIFIIKYSTYVYAQHLSDNPVQLFQNNVL